MHNTLRIARRLAPSIALNVLKTWANGWTTDTWFGVTNSKCRFGCPHGVDALRHYLDCRSLHNAILDAARALLQAGAACVQGLAVCRRV